jgi:hypothetical protein
MPGTARKGRRTTRNGIMEPFDKLVDQLDRELDPEKHTGLIRQAEAIMEQGPPLLAVAWERVNDG